MEQGPFRKTDNAISAMSSKYTQTRVDQATDNANLENVPSSTFSSPFDHGSIDQPIEVQSQTLEKGSEPKPSTQRPRLVGPQSNLRQTTLFGEQPTDISGSQIQSQSTRRHNWPLANREEAQTHHTLDKEALKSWVYPTNLGTIRDYQYNIVARGL